MCTDDRGFIPTFVIRRLSFLIFLAFLILYVATLLPDVLPADSGEFQRVAATAGVAHPPGFPLYTMLGWLFAHLPFGPTPAWCVNFFSAITAAATVALVFRTARQMTGSVWGGLAAALTLGSATTLWATATKASIRPLTALFTALCFYALTRHASRSAFHASRNTQHGSWFTFHSLSSDRYLVLLATALSLGLTHHPSLAFPALAFVAYLILIDPALLRRPRRWLKPLAVFFLGLLVLLYLPLRDPDLATPSAFLNHILARGFRGDMFALNLLDRLVLLPTLLRFQFNDVLLGGACLGAAILLWRDRKLALLLIGSLLVHTAVTLTYDAPQTVEYLMPVYVPLALLVATPFTELPNLKPQSSNLKHAIRNTRYVILVILLVAGLANLVLHLPSYRALSRSRDARASAETLLREVPEDAIILSNWHWFNPMRYLQRIEGMRPDVKVDYVAPGGEPLARTWVRRIEKHVAERPVAVTRYFEREYSDLSYRFEPLGEAFLVRQGPRFEMPPNLSPLDVTLDEQVKLLGYRLETDETEPARPLALTLAWSPIVTPTPDIALFAQLIGPEGKLWSAARDPRHPPQQFVLGEIVVERFVIYPLLHAPPGEYSLVSGAYLPAEPGAPRLTTADGTDAVRLTTVHLRPSTTRPVTQHPHFARFAGGPTLIGAGYDIGVPGETQVRAYLHWAGPGPASTFELLDRHGSRVLGRGRVPALDRGEYASVALDFSSLPTMEEIRRGAMLYWIPAKVLVLDGDRPRRWNLLFHGPAPLSPPDLGERYVPLGDAMVLTGCDGPMRDLERGAEVTLGLRLRSQRPLERDYIISTRLTGLNPDGTWAWRDAHDTVPALGAIPTLKWIRGSAVFDPHRVTIPDDAASVPVFGSLVVYDHFTQATLPALDERLDTTIPLGSWTVASP